MSRLVLVLCDLYPTRLDPSTQVARLPALEQWLARGVADLHGGDWRQWLQREFHRDSGQAEWRAAPPASIAAVAVAGVAPGHAVWFATPVHFVVGLDTLRVHPAGLLRMTLDEQQALSLDFARVFAGSGWSLLATGRRELLLTGGSGSEVGESAGEVNSRDPALWLGTDPSTGLKVGERATPLRRLGAELEMWLHEHGVNTARASRGSLNANAFWLWGGGAPAVSLLPEPAPSRALAWSDDLFVDGLAQLTGALVQPRPERWPATANTQAVEPSGDRLVVLELGATSDARSLLALDRDWIAPALAQLQRGAYQSATLLAGSRAVTLGRAPLRRFWSALRRPRPWWEILLRC